MKAKETKKTIKKTVKSIQTVAARKAELKRSVKPSNDKTSKTKKSPSIRTAAKTKNIEQKPLIAKPIGNTDKKAPKKKAVTIKAEVKLTPKAKVSKVPAVKTKPTVKAEKKAPKKKAATIKTEIKVTPKAKVSKAPAVKTKPTVKAEKKAPKKKAVTIKAEVKVTPKAKVSKAPAVKAKPTVKAEKTAPKKKAVTIKAEVKVTPKAKVEIKPKSMGSEISATKPRPVQKAEIIEAPMPARTKAIKTVSKDKKAVTAKRGPAVPVQPSLKSVDAARKYETREEPKPKTERYPVVSSKARLKIFLPDQDLTKEEAEEVFFGGLPEEYGENAVVALAVDPNTVFVDWEVIPGVIADIEGDLNLRFYDVTGIEFNDWNVHSVLDVLINKRVGSGFFDIRLPGRDVVVAVGIFNAVSGFMPIAWSDMISFPELLTFDELGIVQKLFESGIPVGY